MAKKLTHHPVLVTTVHRGVFFGYLTGKAGKTVTLKNARNCIYWSSDVRGFIGLAVTGPSNSCRIGPRADIELNDVTSIVSVTTEAAARWEAQPWG
jgi:Domain of unknown function (DUF6948)